MTDFPSKTKEDDALVAIIGCACHKQDVGCRGALSLKFPVRMFEPAGELEYRQIRQAAVRDMLAVFDQFYEAARKQLVSIEPLILRPGRGGRNLVVIDAADLSPLAGNGADHTESAEGVSPV